MEVNMRLQRKRTNEAAAASQPRHRKDGGKQLANIISSVCQRTKDPPKERREKKEEANYMYMLPAQIVETARQTGISRFRGRNQRLAYFHYKLTLEAQKLVRSLL